VSAPLSYLGTITIRQGDAKTEATGTRYGMSDAFSGRYWGLDPQVTLHPGIATIRFHDGLLSDAVLTRVAPDSGHFAKAS
jgi:hypothetical protein